MDQYSLSDPVIMMGLGPAVAYVVLYLWLKSGEKQRSELIEKGLSNPDRLEIYAPKGLVGSIAIMFSFVCIFMIDACFTSKVFVVLFGIPLLFFLPLLFMLWKGFFYNGPICALTDQYIEYRDWPFRRVDWNNVKAASISSHYVARMGWRTYLNIEVLNADALIRECDFVERFFYKFTKRMKKPIDITHWQVETERVREMVGRHVEVDTSRWRDDL